MEDNGQFVHGLFICFVHVFQTLFYFIHVGYLIVNQQNECIRENNARFRVPEWHEERELFSGMHEIELINWHNQRGKVCESYIFQKVCQKKLEKYRKIPGKN